MFSFEKVSKMEIDINKNIKYVVIKMQIGYACTDGFWLPSTDWFLQLKIVFILQISHVSVEFSAFYSKTSNENLKKFT